MSRLASTPLRNIFVLFFKEIPLDYFYALCDIHKMKLEMYLNKHNLSRRSFGKLLGSGHGTVCDYISGRRTPCASKMKQIVQITGGEVMPNDFFDEFIDNQKAIKERSASIIRRVKEQMDSAQTPR